MTSPRAAPRRIEGPNSWSRTRRPSQELEVRHAAGRDDDDVGLKREHVLGARVNVEAKGDAEALAFVDPPIDDAQNLAPALQRGREQDLPARLGGGLEDDDFVSALARDARRLEPARPRADHDHLSLGPSEGETTCGIVSSRPVAAL